MQQYVKLHNPLLSSGHHGPGVDTLPVCPAPLRTARPSRQMRLAKIGKDQTTLTLNALSKKLKLFLYRTHYDDNFVRNDMSLSLHQCTKGVNNQNTLEKFAKY